MSDALVLIDVQKAFYDKIWGGKYNLQAEKNIKHLLDYFRIKNKSIIHIKHISNNPNSLFHKDREQDFIFETRNNEIVIEKYVNSAFIGTNLNEILQENNIKHITIAGISLPHCVSTTVRMAQNLGFSVDLIEDATISFDLKDSQGNILNAKDVHKYNIAALNNEFANVYTTEKYIKN
jgi:nicotinamidase-related amidase